MEQYKIDREAAYSANGITKELLAEILWEYIFGQQDNVQSRAQEIQNKRLEIKALYPKPE